MIVFPVGRHISKIFGNIGYDFTGLLPEPTVAGYIAGILVGDRLLDFFKRINLNAAIPQVFRQQLNIMNNVNRRLPIRIAGEIGAFKSQRTIGVPAFGNQNMLGF